VDTVIRRAARNPADAFLARAASLWRAIAVRAELARRRRRSSSNNNNAGQDQLVNELGFVGKP